MAPRKNFGFRPWNGVECAFYWMVAALAFLTAEAFDISLCAWALEPSSLSDSHHKFRVGFLLGATFCLNFGYLIGTEVVHRGAHFRNQHLLAKALEWGVIFIAASLIFALFFAGIVTRELPTLGDAIRNTLLAVAGAATLLGGTYLFRHKEM